MKKRVLAMILATFVALFLGACSEDVPSENQDNEQEENQVQDKGDEEYAESQPQEGDSYFQDGVLEIDDVRIQITDYRVIPVGDPGNEYGDVPVIAFWYDITNLSDEDGAVTPSDWVYWFEAVQDNDPNKINKLEVASHPDENLMNDQLSEIKAGGTLQGAMAYELTDETTPVELVASDFLGDEIGSQMFEIAA